MCGHDGHAACLLGGMSIYLQNLSKIPSNRGVRFLFQPGEEGAGGAREMIKAGCLENVDEIYGNHNMPRRELAGKVCCNAGPMMAGFSIIEVKIKGIGGHGSKPECCKNPVPVTAEVYLKMQALLDQAMAENSELKGSIPKLVGSNALNVIPEDCTIAGTIRSFSKTYPIELLEKMEQATKEICDARGFEFEWKSQPNFFKPVINDEWSHSWVKKAVTEVYGEGMCTDEGCPVFASEDFSDFCVGNFFFSGAVVKR